MCAPCKVIINEENQHAAKMGSLLRDLVLNPPNDDPEADDFLYELAKYEVAYIKSARCAAVKFAERHGASDRWIALLKELA